MESRKRTSGDSRGEAQRDEYRISEWTYLLPDLGGGSVLVIGASDDGAEVRAIKQRWPDVIIQTLDHRSSPNLERKFDAAVFGMSNRWTPEALVAVRRNIRGGGTVLIPFPPGRGGLLSRLASLVNTARLRSALRQGGFFDRRFYVALPDRDRPSAICLTSASRLLDRVLRERRLDSRRFLARLHLTLIQRALRLEPLAPIVTNGWIVAR